MEKAKKFHETEERKENANRVELSQHSAKFMIFGKPVQASEKENIKNSMTYLFKKSMKMHSKTPSFLLALTFCVFFCFGQKSIFSLTK
jgi:hypothetical protein